MIAIDLPATGSPVTIDTCGSAVDSLLAAGTGCPDTTSFAFGCRGFNDDATSDFCTPGASRLTFNATTSRIYVTVQGFGNDVGAYTVNFRYLQPSTTPTSSVTPSPSSTGTGTVTPGLPPSQSMTQTPRPAPPTDTPSTSVSGSITPSNRCVPHSCRQAAC